jgi:hypothetical protein
MSVGGDEEDTAIESDAGDLGTILDREKSRKADERDGKEGWGEDNNYTCNNTYNINRIVI